MYNIEEEFRFLNGERQLTDVSEVINNETYSPFMFSPFAANDENEDEENTDYVSVPTSEHKKAKITYAGYCVQNYVGNYGITFFSIVIFARKFLIINVI